MAARAGSLPRRCSPSPDAFDPKAVLRAIDPVERDLLRLLLSVPETQEATAERLAPADLPSQPARELWTAMLALREDPPYTTERVFARLAADPETQALLVALLERRDAGTDAGTTDPRVASQGIEQCLLRLELDRLEERTRWTRVELGEAERANDRPTIERLMTQEQHHNENREVAAAADGAGKPAQPPRRSTRRRRTIVTQDPWTASWWRRCWPPARAAAVQPPPR